MRIILNSIFRALCAIAVGALLVKYRQEMVQWMTIVIGILFILAGVVAVIMAYYARRTAKNMIQALQNTANIDASAAENIKRLKPSRGWGWGMSAGTGSIILGVVLTTMPETFTDFLVYILAAVLIIGAIQQFLVLALAQRSSTVGTAFWIMPSLLLAAGVIALAYPAAIASAPLFFIGWCIIIYGIVECINGVKAYKCHKKTSTEISLNSKPDFSNAETVEYEEIKPEE